MVQSVGLRNGNGLWMAAAKDPGPEICVRFNFRTLLTQAAVKMACAARNKGALLQTLKCPFRLPDIYSQKNYLIRMLILTFLLLVLMVFGNKMLKEA